MSFSWFSRLQLYYRSLIALASSIFTHQFLNKKLYQMIEKKCPFTLLETINKYVVVLEKVFAVMVSSSKKHLQR